MASSHRTALKSVPQAPTSIADWLIGDAVHVLVHLARAVTSPTELIKIQQQSIITPPGKVAPTVQDVARDIWRRRGFRGLFRGIGPTALRETGYGAYFGVYEGTLMLLSPMKGHDDTKLDHSSLREEAAAAKMRHTYPALLLAGGLAGVISWVVTFPFDVIKTRVQSTLSTARDNPYRSMMSTIVNSYRQEGLSVFFHGLKPTLIRYHFFGCVTLHQGLILFFVEQFP